MRQAIPKSPLGRQLGLARLAARARQHVLALSSRQLRMLDMCENAGAREGRWSGCPRCNGCYNPDIPEDVTLCAQDRCRDRGAFDSCIGNLNARAALQCVRLVQPSAVCRVRGRGLG
ncbi:hypothetical protein BCR44DRAFT_1509761 [Catenaria anguillulae PL171]|uniref:Uncharacterized protein n=1 Tax=Catenaria anguillulae PL171 TaxID=765915 RepID=A0A1Y2I1E3_9FUNG|nr:hypothetical protein BCR44DRAFT_1509761 [Catenaria anguillulae PL171]